MKFKNLILILLLNLFSVLIYGQSKKEFNFPEQTLDLQMLGNKGFFVVGFNKNVIKRKIPISLLAQH